LLLFLKNSSFYYFFPKIVWSDPIFRGARYGMVELNWFLYMIVFKGLTLMVNYTKEDRVIPLSHVSSKFSMYG
jgi:hypothetical protein